MNCSRLNGGFGLGAEWCDCGWQQLTGKLGGVCLSCSESVLDCTFDKRAR